MQIYTKCLSLQPFHQRVNQITHQMTSKTTQTAHSWQICVKSPKLATKLATQTAKQAKTVMKHSEMQESSLNKHFSKQPAQQFN